MKKQKSLVGSIVTVVAVFVWLVLPARAIELSECLDLSGHFKNETYVRAWHGPDDIMSCRNVLNLDLEYSFPRGTIFKRFFIQLRPFYDAVFDWENEGTGGASDGIPPGSGIVYPPQQGRHIREKYQDNFGVADDGDPLLRECWIELEIGDLNARLGRQLVSWGKSDGIYMLDVIHPFNDRNWSIFEEEDTKIPLWMVNLTYSFSVYSNLQLLIIPRYVPHYDPSNGHDWALNVVKLVDEFYADPGYFYGLPGAFGSTTIRFDEPDYGDPSNWEWGIRWSGMWKGLCYTLNYFYTWDDIMNDYPQDPFGIVYKRNPDRLSVIGGSFDYAFGHALGIENWVLRGEVAYFKNDVFVDAHFHGHERDHIDYMLGFDKPFFVDYNVSIALKQSILLNSPSWRNAYLNGLGATRLKELLTIPGVGTFPIVEGFRDTVETTLTFYVMKDYMPGDWLHTECFLLWDDEGSWWFRPKVKYDYTTKIHVSLGCNIYWGNEEDDWGQFGDNDNIFLEFKYDF